MAVENREVLPRARRVFPVRVVEDRIEDAKLLP